MKQSLRQFTDRSVINEVANGNLYIGNYCAAKNFSLLKEIGITHILNAAHELKNKFRIDFHYISLNLCDSQTQLLSHEVLERSYDFIKNVVETPGAKVFVHCHAGISRSSSIVIYFLMKYHSMSYEKAREYLRSRHTIANPNSYFAYQLSGGTNSSPGYTRSGTKFRR